MEYEQKNREKELQRAKKLAFGWLARRSFFSAELAEKLYRNGVEKEVVVELIQELRSSGFLDDDRLLADTIERGFSRGKGREKILFECARKTGSKPVWKESDELRKKEEASIRNLLRKKRFEDPRKAVRFLQSRGFRAEMIRSVLFQPEEE